MKNHLLPTVVHSFHLLSMKADHVIVLIFEQQNRTCSLKSWIFSMLNERDDDKNLQDTVKRQKKGAATLMFAYSVTI